MNLRRSWFVSRIRNADKSLTALAEGKGQGRFLVERLPSSGVVTPDAGERDSVRWPSAWSNRTTSSRALGQKRIRVLLIEHDPAFARLVQVALETAEVDFDVHLVTTLADALDAPVVNVVLLGLNLPDSDGLSSMKGIGMERITATEVRLRSLLAVSFPEPVS